MHDRDDRRVVGDRVAQRVGPDDAALVDGQERHPPAAASQRLERIEHGFVLDGGGDQMLAAGRLERLGGAANGEVVAFGAAGGKHDLRGVAAEQGRDLAPRVVDDGLGLLTEMVNARRVAPHLPDRPVHPVGHFGRDRGRRVVIEIDAATVCRS